MTSKNNKKQSEKSFKIEVAVTTRDSCYDPEGNTIVEQLAHRSGYTDIHSIRVGKLIRMDVRAESSDSAKASATSLCDDIGYFTSVNSVVVKDVSTMNGKSSKGANESHQTVEAIINYKDGIPNPESQPVLDASKDGKYAISGINVSKLLRIKVNLGVDAIEYVSLFDSECALHNPIIHHLELRLA